MSLVYWGIVAGLAALVATFFVCIDVLYSHSKGSSGASSSMTHRSAQSTEPASSKGRYAA